MGSTACSTACSLSVPLPSIYDNSGVTESETNEENSKTLLKGMRYAELEKWVQSHEFRPGQAMMLWKRLYGDNIWANTCDESLQILFTLDDGLVIKTVIIPCERGRNTVCVSSQVGCAMNCQFYYTGRMGLRRHLTAAEIVEQAVFARRLFTNEVGSITNVVFMLSKKNKRFLAEGEATYYKQAYFSGCA